MQRSSFLHSWLEVPWFYNGLQWVIGATRERAEFLREVARIAPGEKVVDVGCGPARMLEGLPPVAYVGFDPNADYIAVAQARHGGRGVFLCGHAASPEVLEAASGADVVVSLGVLHHLTDGQIEEVFTLAKRCLRPGGRLVLYEPSFTAQDDPVGRMFMRMDRGGNVKTDEGWREVARRHFAEVEESFRRPVYLFRYTIQVLVCRGARG